MSTERKATVTYVTDGTQNSFAFPFDYLRRAFVKVKIGVDLLTYENDYTVSGNIVNLLSTPPAGSLLKIYRETTTTRLVVWEDASIFRAADLTLFDVQLLHLIEEAWDNVLESCLLFDVSDNTWNAQGYRMKNLADPVDPQDAMTKNYFETESTGYLNAVMEFARKACLCADESFISAEESKQSAAEAAESAAQAKNVTEILKLLLFFEIDENGDIMPTEKSVSGGNIILGKSFLFTFNDLKGITIIKGIYDKGARCVRC